MDGVSLAAGRKKVTGVWRGVYGYGSCGNLPGLAAVAFTLKLKQGWTAHFTGSVNEDAPHGIPGNGTVDGYFNHPTIEFTKQMPVGYVLQEDGSRQTLREHLAEQGYGLKPGIPGANRQSVRKGIERKSGSGRRCS